MAVLLSPVGGVAGQFFDNNGNPLTGGKLYSYVAGTTTPQATYTSSAGTVAHSNPIILDAGGRVPGGEIWLTDGLQYKFVLKNANDVLIGTYDNIVGINSNFVNFLTETEVQTATAGQTVFTLTTMQYQPGTNNLTVYVDGVNQIDGSTYSYVETSSTVITFTAGLHVGALVKFTTAQTLSTGVTDAALVTYDPPFTGSVTTTVELKLAQTVSVKDFGAVGDGVTDDTTAIQAAFSAADIAQPKTVYFPAGTYLTNSTITVNPNTTNGAVPQIVGEGSQATIIKAGPSLGANAILKHQGASPSANSKWTGFQLLGTGAANGQYGVYHINTCFVNYDDITFNDLQEGIRFENAGAGFSEQNVLSNCWAAACKYFIGFARQSGSTQDSFRGTGFSSECHMDLTTVANARLVRVYLLNSLAPNCYNMPIFATIWTNATSAVLQNDSATPIRASGYIRYESSATGWVMGTGSALVTDTFRGIMDGIAFNPTPNTCDIIGIVNGSYYTDYNTFTPVLTATGGAPTVTYAANGQQGFYEVVGVTVNFSIFLNISSYTGGSGNLQISGLPFTSRTNTGSISINRIPVAANKLTFTGIPFARVPNNGTTLDIVQTTSGNDEAAITLASLAASNSSLFISGSYTWAAGN